MREYIGHLLRSEEASGDSAFWVDLVLHKPLPLERFDRAGRIVNRDSGPREREADLRHTLCDCTVVSCGEDSLCVHTHLAGSEREFFVPWSNIALLEVIRP